MCFKNCFPCFSPFTLSGLQRREERNLDTKLETGRYIQTALRTLVHTDCFEDWKTTPLVPPWGSVYTCLKLGLKAKDWRPYWTYWYLISFESFILFSTLVFKEPKSNTLTLLHIRNNNNKPSLLPNVHKTIHTVRKKRPSI